MTAQQLTREDVLALLKRVDRRCEIELGFPAHDALGRWPDAGRRIFTDEWGHLTRRLLAEVQA